MTSKNKLILGSLAIACLLGALLYVKPWQTAGPTGVQTTQTQAPDQTQIVISPKSGKKHPLSEFKPAPDQPGWVICPDTGQKLPLVSLKR